MGIRYRDIELNSSLLVFFTELEFSPLHEYNASSARDAEDTPVVAEICQHGRKRVFITVVLNFNNSIAVWKMACYAVTVNECFGMKSAR